MAKTERAIEADADKDALVSIAIEVFTLIFNKCESKVEEDEVLRMVQALLEAKRKL